MTILVRILANWKWLLGAAVSIALSIALLFAQANARHWHKRFDQEAAAHAADIAEWKAASEKARADNLAHVHELETRQTAITEKHNAQIRDDAARYRRLAADYGRLHAVTAAYRGDTSGAGLSAPPDASRGPDTLSGATVVPLADLERCADAYAVATGWQHWWSDVSAAGN